MAISFKVAQNSDIDQLISFMQAYYDYDHIPFDEARARNTLGTMIADPACGYAWLIYRDNRVVGYVVLALGYSLEFGRDAFLDEIYIQEAYRGQGIGTKALTFVEGTCRELGVQALHLEVEQENIKAQEFYRKMGYEDHHRFLLTKWV
jgi:ribosomal protein S18 acetylase RimI-like enzyme